MVIKLKFVKTKFLLLLNLDDGMDEDILTKYIQFLIFKIQVCGNLIL